MPLYIEQSEDLDRSHGCLTHSQTLKDRATHKVSEWSSRNAISVTQDVFTPFSIVFCGIVRHMFVVIPLFVRCVRSIF